MAKRHSAVCYVFRDGEFSPVEDAKPFPNGLGLDLFVYKGQFYEGKSGLRLCSVCGESELLNMIGRNGGPARLEKQIADSVEKNGLSPRYTRPEETKKQVFPKVKDENTVLAKDLSGKKHYFYRFHNEDGIELFTMKKNDEFFATVYVPCEGYMVGIDQKHRLEEILKWLPTLEGGIKGEVELRFDECMKDPHKWADPGFATLLGRTEEAKAHNAPILEERQRKSAEEAAAREEQEQQKRQERIDRRRQAIRQAEQDIMDGKEVIDEDGEGNSLLLQLFREHQIEVPLRTQGWIARSLYSVQYSPQADTWQCDYYGYGSTKISQLLPKLSAAIQTRRQYESQPSPELEYDTPEEEENDLER